MHRCCRYGGPLEVQVFRGAGIFGHGAGEAEIEGGTNGRVDAHLAHRPADHQIVDFVVLQVFQQVGVAKAVGKMLHHDDFLIPGRHQWMDACAIGVGEEKRRPGASGKVLDMDDR